jgi:hypothetical protein
MRGKDSPAEGKHKEYAGQDEACTLMQYVLFLLLLKLDGSSLYSLE